MSLIATGETISANERSLKIFKPYLSYLNGVLNLIIGPIFCAKCAEYMSCGV